MGEGSLLLARSARARVPSAPAPQARCRCTARRGTGTCVDVTAACISWFCRDASSPCQFIHPLHSCENCTRGHSPVQRRRPGSFIYSRRVRTRPRVHNGRNPEEEVPICNKTIILRLMPPSLLLLARRRQCTTGHRGTWHAGCCLPLMMQPSCTLARHNTHCAVAATRRPCTGCPKRRRSCCSRLFAPITRCCSTHARLPMPLSTAPAAAAAPSGAGRLALGLEEGGDAGVDLLDAAAHRALLGQLVVLAGRGGG